MSESPIATAADYADAMLTARRAKNWLFLLILLMLLVQVGLFFFARYGNQVVPAVVAPPIPVIEVEPATTQAALQIIENDAATRPVAQATTNDLIPLLTQYLTGLINFLGILLAIVLSMVLLLLVKIMLVGRLIGVSRVTAAYIWSIVLVVLLFPWQAFLNNADFSADFKIPGVLYTWAELVHQAKLDLSVESISRKILFWARWVVLPVFTIGLLLVIQAKSNRGLKLALGESEPELPPTTEI